MSNCDYHIASSDCDTIKDVTVGVGVGDKTLALVRRSSDPITDLSSAVSAAAAAAAAAACHDIYQCSWKSIFGKIAEI